METLKDKIVRLYPGCKFKLGETEESTVIYIKLRDLFPVDFYMHPQKMFMKMIVCIEQHEIDLVSKLTTEPTPSGIGKNRERMYYQIKQLFEYYVSKHPTTAKLLITDEDIVNYVDSVLDDLKAKYRKSYDIYFGIPTHSDASTEDDYD